ncbi:MAG TPA: 4-hydroxybenzoate octaprenyltransferase [Dehalococcoidia bacterium]|uniref:4-hydroxybenzoate polyprenyltransferase n=1 Tax=marine metagenome TaxID=408172 RepID=A0A381VDR5_9ZZZZ|nr:putative 4-hydroxybenzoate polyprenyltransferase [SAR202 cluster bacterium]HBF00890.1 4-hydroxybenzoate octaprenyltransferase [Dehalococcoidia bacterium]|tara:strand:- start:862 stop:1728 length:867 start_codon:yes stop_codon:yes gene_type:complete
MLFNSIWPKVPNFFDAIKFQESIFSLPFAYIGMLLAIQGIPDFERFFWITLAMVSARTVGMIANRIIDRHIDSKSPRSSQRHLPSGILSVTDLLVPGIISSLIFMFCAYMLNTLALILAPLALIYLVVYPFTKRFTWLANILLGWALAIAPSAAWIGMVGKLEWQPVLLSTSVALWAGSFDIIYHTQDVSFQKKEKLHSVASRFGITKAFKIAQGMDVLAVLCLIILGVWMELGLFYYGGCGLTLIFLVYKYRLVTPSDLSRMGMSFMRINAFVSCSMLLGTITSLMV